MKITRRQLRQIVTEAIDIMDGETGELMVFDDADGAEYGIKPDAPEAAAMDMMKRLGIESPQPDPRYSDETPTYTISGEEYDKMSDELYGKRAARKSKADKERLDIDNLMARAAKWASEAGTDFAMDNPDMNLEDVAWDLSDSAEFEFKEDEWNELLYHFDFNPDDLRTYISDMLAGAASGRID